MMAGDLCWHSGMRCFGLLGIGSQHVTYPWRESCTMLDAMLTSCEYRFHKNTEGYICGGFPLIRGSGSLNTGL